MSRLSSDIGRQALVTLAGTILAAAVIGAVPRLRDWIARQWMGR
ncbi:hypothetical protein [Leptothrix discophora]|uniref:Uncharacterized protein n=1 Tax=Leptothrix discophora TaxID=89 RepID=A0ABT9FZE5_LEPDI|nr:hypothetical protein [Leptothrix discophora]MDP4299531.1 hypothetical protein [Leptothrix discophora]